MTRVLVVEDEESYRDALAYVLQKEGFDVALAATGPEALSEFERSGADIVLLDLMLPGLPGTEVCRRLRQMSSVPVIVVSAKDTEVDKVVGLELGADDYVTKPYSPRELVARLRAGLRRGRDAARGAAARGTRPGGPSSALTPPCPSRTAPASSSRASEPCYDVDKTSTWRRPRLSPDAYGWTSSAIWPAWAEATRGRLRE